ncbi:MAG: lysylphosphatidylglycerol synthase transmembrane domain-containing protein [Planctomycetota bacterium]
MRTALRRHLMTALRLLVIAGGLGYIAYTVQWQDATVTPADAPPGAAAELRPGMVSLVRSADLRWLGGGLLLIALVFPLQALRWYLLMRCRGLAVSFWSVQRLVMIGLFFNFCVPVGSNGGDVVKAYGAAKGTTTPGSTAIAIVSVLLDRVAGLLGLIALAAITGPLMWDDPTGRKIAVFAWSALALVVVGSVVYHAPATRRALGLELLTRFGIVQKIDDAVRGYRDHLGVLLGAIGLSLPVHLALSIATAMAGYAIGAPTPLLVMVVALPIVFIVGALPLTFMGLGVMEPTAVALLTGGEDAATANQVIAMLMAWRAYLLAYAILGGALMLSKGMHLNDVSAKPVHAAG